MSGWSINAPGVQSVLTSVETAATELSTALDGMSAAFSELSSGAGSGLADVPAAVQALITSEQNRLIAIGNRITAGSLGASAATIGYVQGDEEMAATAQAAASQAASSGDLSFFTGAS
ncbi:DUF6507 family protein [Cryobacterium sp. PH31-O1]|uniref:DUF6507 family protein n=1 Tax=Cryobacterium sp. PH31-O1 TaxID=3046306 RepID=UPI0024B950DC|nr:DUF6507 family protein [Cryobacterium sp. PH31-O1]MDJ0338454.1 DUF6507 family protein [Cryobacterium sp. PH31-O1]